MKRPLLVLSAVLIVAASAQASAIAPNASLAAEATAAGQYTGTDPEIVALRGKRVWVRVPEGFDRVTLQVFAPRHRRTVKQNRGIEWRTVATKYPHRASTVLEFRLQRLTARRHLRVFGNTNQALPANFFTGVTNFAADPAQAAPGAADTGVSGEQSLGGPGAVANAAFKATDASTAESRDVAEADIWKIVGDRLYYFNQLRGLQLFDVADPKDPVLLGTLRMPAVGEDMYVLESGHAVLLKRATNWLWDDWFWWGGGPILFFNAIDIEPVGPMNLRTTDPAVSLSADAASVRTATLAVQPQQQANRSSEVLVADVSSGTPAILSRIAFDGTLRESRMVGKVLYVAADVNRPEGQNTAAQWGCEITSFDLSDPAHPVKRDSIYLGGWANAVQATDQFFFVAKWADSGTWFGGSSNSVDILDISAPDGTMQRGGQVKVPGNVADKFKLHQHGETLAVVSGGGRYEDAAGNPLVDWGNGARWRPFTTLNTFSLADFRKPAALGSVEIARGETVRATRFDGDLAYVVTFVQIDPLWVISIADPARPKIIGHVEAPGFSTYIEPLGDRLVTIGLVRGRPAVTLFDVSNEVQPVLLKQIILGNNNDDDYAYSEAVWDEKAFKVLPEQNLILLPVSNYRAADGEASSVQLIDLFENNIVQRGIVTAHFYPRRATVHHESIISVSPKKLVTVDARDRDHPVVQAEVEIAWGADRLFVVGDFLVQLSDTWSNQPSLTVTPGAQPEQSLARLDLAVDKPVVGATMRDGVLYVAQASSGWTYDIAAFRDVDVSARVYLSLYDVSALPAIQLLGTTSTRPEPVAAKTYGGWGIQNLEPLWPNPNTLVWAGRGQSRYWWAPVWIDPPPYELVHPIVDANTDDADDDEAVSEENGESIDPPGFWSREWRISAGKQFFAFDVASVGAPKHLSTLELGRREPWDVSEPFAADGSIYLSHRHLGVVQPADDFFEGLNAANNNVASPADDDLFNRHFLDLIDYSDPATPAVSADHPNLPGRLVGLSRHGMLLYTMGQGYESGTGQPIADSTALHASAFDGTIVHLLDAIPLTAEGEPFLLDGETVFLLKPEPPRIFKPNDDKQRYWDGVWEENPAKSILTTWTLSDVGKFTRLDEIALEHESNVSLFGRLAVAHGGASHGGIFLRWGWNSFGWHGGDSRTLHFVDATNPADLHDVGTYTFEGGVYPDLTFADGDEERGLWVPLGEYGVEQVTHATP